MELIILEEKLKLLIDVFEQLGNVEVKGDSVIHLYNARINIKNVVESVKKKEEKSENGVNNKEE